MKKKKKYITAEQVQAGAKENQKRRKERKEQVKSLFVKRRGEAETNRSWKGPRKFEEWLFTLAERVLGGSSIEDSAQVHTLQACLGLELCLQVLQYERKASRALATALAVAGASDATMDLAFKTLDGCFNTAHEDKNEYI
jgi:hypothetical protein